MTDKYTAEVAGLNKVVVEAEANVTKLLGKLGLLTASGAGAGMGGTQGGNVMSSSMGAFSGSAFGAMSGLGKAAAVFGGVANLAAGTATAFSKAMPSVTDTMNMSMQSYQTSLSAPGVNKYQVAQSTFNAMRGGITSPGAQAMVGAGLASMGVQFSTNQNSTYQTMLREVKNSAMYLGQDNMTAMNAIAGLGTGSMSANLTATMGIYTSNPITGKSLNQNQIFSQIWSQMRAGQGKMTAKDVMDSYYKGNLGASLNNIGFNDAQKQQFLQYAVNQVGGKNMDLSSNSAMKSLMGANNSIGNSNPMQASMDIFTTTTKQMITAMKPYEQGMKDAAKLYQQMDPAVESLIKNFGRLNAETQTLAATNVGQAIMSAGNTLVDALGSIVTMLLNAKILGALKGVKVPGGGTTPSAAKPGYYDYAVQTSKANAAEQVAADSSAGLSAGAAAGGSAMAGAFAANYLSLSGNKNKSSLSSYISEQVRWTQQRTGKFFSATDFLQYGTGPNVTVGAGASPTPQTGGPTNGTKNGNGTGGTSDYGLRHGTNGAHAPANGPITAHLHQMGPMWGAHGHNGTDYGVPDGSPIYAIADGKVSTDATSAGKGAYGHYLKIDHGNGYQTLYAHLSPSSADVHPGEQVKAGQKIGKSGHSGWVTGPHLHFEVQKNGTSVDPGPALAGSLSNGGKALTKSSSTSNMSTAGAASVPSLFNTSSSGFSFSGWSVAEAMGTSGTMSTVGASSWKGTQTPSGKTISVGTSAGASPNTQGGSPVNGSYNGIGLGSASIVGGGGGTAVAGGKVEINLHIASASAQEARKFAALVKQILEEEQLVSNMGSR